MKIYYLIIIFILSFSVNAFSQEKSKEQKELIEVAEKYFQEKNFRKALPLYSQLLSIYPTEAIYSYYYGACLVENNKEIDKAIKYLVYGAKKLKEQPLVFYYLGSAYHLNYQFGNAITQYNKFQENASTKEKKDKNIERVIEICNNGLSLVQYSSSLIVLDNKKIKQKNFHYSYDLVNMGGKLVVKPDVFKTKVDIKQKKKELIFISDSGKVFFSSLGNNKNGSRDIFWTEKDSDGEFLPSQNIGNIINTPYDEDYPFLMANETRLYFCSKGHNTMGGYDVFRSDFDSLTNEWANPVNLDFPTNTPYDDLLYIVDADENLAYFASNRESKENSLNVYKIQIDKEPVERAIENVEDIQYIAKLSVTPLAERQKTEASKEIILATTETAGNNDKGPRTTFDFEAVYAENVSSAKDYTSTLKSDLKQLKYNLKRTELRKRIAANITHNRTGKLRELQGKIQTRIDNPEVKNEDEIKEITNLIERAVKTNTEAKISAETTEILTKEIALRKREILITEMLLNDSSNNNKQELVQNINANRDFLQRNNLTYLSLNTWAKEKEIEKLEIDKREENKRKQLDKARIKFKSVLNDYQANSNSLSNAGPENKEEFALEKNMLKDELNISKIEVVNAEKELFKEEEIAKRTDREISFLNRLNNETSDQQNQDLAENNQELDNQLIISNAKAINDIVVAAQLGQKNASIFELYDSQTAAIFDLTQDVEAQKTADLNTEAPANLAQNEMNVSKEVKQKPENKSDDILADSESIANDKLDNNSNKSAPNKLASDIQDEPKEDIISESPSPNENLEKHIVSKDLTEVFSYPARLKFAEAKQASQLSDSLANLATEKDIRVNYISNVEQQEVIRNEIEELKQLSNIKFNQSLVAYKEANAIEKKFVEENVPDTVFENFIKTSILAIEASKEVSPEFIEYKKAAFKEKYFEQGLDSLGKEGNIIEANLLSQDYDQVAKEKFQSNLAVLLNVKGRYEAELALAKVKQSEMKEIILENAEHSPVSEAWINESGTASILSKQLVLTKAENKKIQSIDKERANADETFVVWDEDLIKISKLETALSIEENQEQKTKLAEEISNLEKEAWPKNQNANQITHLANVDESDLLSELLDKNKKNKSKGSPEAYVFEKESDLFFSKAAAIRESIKNNKQYSDITAKAYKKAVHYEEIGINKQKAALNIYASLPDKEIQEVLAESQTQQYEEIPSEKIAKNEAESPDTKDAELDNEKLLVVSVIDEEERTDEYNKLYEKAKSKEKKVVTQEEDIKQLRDELDQSYAPKEKEKLRNKIKLQEEKTKNTILESDGIEQKANLLKRELFNDKNKNALNSTVHNSKKAIAEHLLLDSDFYYEEAQKVKVDSSASLFDLKATIKHRNELMKEGIEAQELAYNSLTGTDDDQYIKSEPLVISNPVVIQKGKYETELVRKVQSTRIMDRLELTSYDIKLLKKTEKLKKDRKILLDNQLINQSKIKTLKDSLSKQTDAKLERKLVSEISKLEKTSVSNLFSIEQISEPINYEKYITYKEHINKHRIKGRTEKAVSGRTLEKAANKSFRKAQNLRTRSFDTSDDDKAYSMLSEASDLELEAIDEIEKAYTIYMDLAPIEDDIEKYLSENTDTNSIGIHGYKLVESVGDIEPFTLPVSDSLNQELANAESANTESILLEDSLQDTVENLVEEPVIVESQSTEEVEDELPIQPSVESQESNTDQLVVEAKSIEADSLLNEPKIEEVIVEDEVAVEPQIIDENNLLNQEEVIVENLETDEQVTPIEVDVVEDNQIEEVIVEAKVAVESDLVDENKVLKEEEVIVGNLETVEEIPTVENEVIEDQQIEEPGIVETQKELDKTAGNLINNNTVKNPTSLVSMLDISSANEHNKNNPIPLDNRLPAGIVYKIQIGAFTKPIPHNSFRGISPVSGETRQDSKYIRYFVGLFNTFDAANTALPYIKGSGYQDAFVVAYKDGLRIAVYLAKNESITQDNYQALAQVERAAVIEAVNSTAGDQAGSPEIQTESNPSVDVAIIQGAYYTVQIGAYKAKVSHSRLKNLTPLYNDKTGTGLIRYYVGKYMDYNQAALRKGEIRKAGIKDAYVTAFNNGSKITLGEARKVLAAVSDNDINKPELVETTEPIPQITPKVDVENLTFRVQIGAFSKSVPVEVVSSYIRMSKLDQLDHFVSKTGKSVYTIGRYKSLAQARLLKQDLVSQGITDAFIIAHDGKLKVSIDEAKKLLNL